MPETTTSLTDELREILSFERGWWKYAGAKETEIRHRFDMSPTRYAQVLLGVIDHPAAMAADPTLVRRLQRLRDGRRAQRTRLT
ncbi:DUF3263 domain-containing protein [Nocardioides sp. Leaf374]|uniref:DUF3263 domain-containing protein n=1 Tax=Nocardioides sp. Leaf374 TaxID=2876560 RepID=UPI001E2CE4C6|nr:DUF3263 domain-containing protein [Nocardioides sp. Leaf374]